MSAHTHGPWVLHTSPNCWTVLQAGSSGRWHIAGGTGWGIPGKWSEAEANARLISAAPDLLAALRDAVTLLTALQVSPHHRAGVVAAARAAIAKADPESAEPEPIPAGEATDSDFGAFEDAAR